MLSHLSAYITHHRLLKKWLHLGIQIQHIQRPCSFKHSTIISEPFNIISLSSFHYIYNSILSKYTYYASGVFKTAPLLPDVTIEAYLLRYPVVTLGSLGCHFAFLAASSSSETLSSSLSLEYQCL